MGGDKFLRRAVIRSSAEESAKSSNGNRPAQTWTNDCRSTEPSRRACCIFAEAIRRRLSAAKRVDGSTGAAERESSWQCSPVAGSAARRGGIGSLDWQRERCESPAGPCQRARTRNGDSARARGGARAIAAPIVARGFAAFYFRRHGGFGVSVLVEGFS